MTNRRPSTPVESPPGPVASIGRELVPAGQRSPLVAQQRAARPGETAGITSDGPQLDAFREIRTSLLAMAAERGLTHFTCLVVGTGPESGGDFVARNLATAFARQEGCSSILMDCNYRHPTQQNLISRPTDGGLFDYLDQRQQAVTILTTPISNLYVIPAGRPDMEHKEYFSSQLISEVLQTLRRPRCYIVIDGPPTKGSPDARILSSLVDFVVLVVGYATSTSDDINKSVAQFEREKFAGVVFNEAST